MTWALNGNYTDQQTRTAQGITYDRAGALGASPDVYASGIPKLRAILAATYQEGAWSLTAQGRFIGSARLTNGTEGQAAIKSASLSPAGVLTRGDIFGLVDDNSIGAVAYLDLRGVIPHRRAFPALWRDRQSEQCGAAGHSQHGRRQRHQPDGL